MQRLLRGIAIGLVLIALGIGAVYIGELPSRSRSDSGILVCEQPERSRRLDPDWLTAHQQAEVDFIESIAAETSIDLQVMTASLQHGMPQNVSSLESLLALTAANPDNEFAALQALQSCVHSPEHAGCDAATINRVVAPAAENAVAWALVSALRFQQDDDFGAASALSTAVNAPSYDDYYAKILGMLLDITAPVAEDEILILYPKLLSRALTLMPYDYNSYKYNSDMCDTGADVNPALATSCLNYGLRVQQESDTLIGTKLGEALQSVTYLAQGNTAESDRIETAFSRSPITADLQATYRLLEIDPNLIREYFEHMAEFGELSAMEFVTSEAKRLSSDTDYNPCSSMAWPNTLYKLQEFASLLPGVANFR